MQGLGQLPRPTHGHPNLAWRLFKEGLIYEQSAVRTLREQQEKRPSKCARQPLKIEQLPSAPVSTKIR